MYGKNVTTQQKIKYLSNRRKIKIKPVPERKYKYIEISDIERDIGETNYTERIGSELPPNARIPIIGGELLISKVRPTRKAITIVPNDLEGDIICSSAFTVLTAPSPIKEYIFILLRSIVGLLQLEQPTTGTEYPIIKDDDIMNIQLPILPKEIQIKLAQFVQKSYSARKKARNLLQQAKGLVEVEIEKKIKS